MGLRSAHAGFIQYVAFHILYPRYANYAGLKSFAETSGMENIVVIVECYTQKPIEIVESSARYTSGSNAEKIQATWRRLRYYLKYSERWRGANHICRGGAFSIPKTYLLLLERYLDSSMDEQTGDSFPNFVLVTRCIHCILRPQTKNEQIFSTAGIFHRKEIVIFLLGGWTMFWVATQNIPVSPWLENQPQSVDIVKTDVECIMDRETNLVNRVSVDSFMDYDKLWNNLLIKYKFYQFFILEPACAPCIRRVCGSRIELQNGNQG